MHIFFDVPLSTKTREEVHDQFEVFLDSDRCHHVVTVNAEMLVEAFRDFEFKQVLQECDLPVVDGSGPQILSKVFPGPSIKERSTGSGDVLRMLFQLADRDQLRVAFVGGLPESTERAAILVQEDYEYATVRAFGAGADFQYLGEGKWRVDESVIAELFAFQPHIVAVALGHGKQEFFIRDFAQHIPSVRIGVGIGGAFAFFAGVIERAPVKMQKLGLEWLWRLYQEPSRYKRIFTAVIVFPSLVIYDKLRALFRKN